MSFTATYISANSFKILSQDARVAFPVTSRAAVDCSGVWVASHIITSTYDGSDTTITLNANILSSPCGEVIPGGITVGTSGNMPPHTHEDDDTGGDDVQGSPPAHIWIGTTISFDGPAGYGPYVDLKGDAGTISKSTTTSEESYLSTNIGITEDGTLIFVAGQVILLTDGVHRDYFTVDAVYTAYLTVTPLTYDYGTEYYGSQYAAYPATTSYVVVCGEPGPDGIQGDSFTPRGSWTTPTVYLALDLVSNDGSSYVCEVGHTSDATTEPGVGTYWETYWTLVSNKGDIGNHVEWNGPWLTSTVYTEDLDAVSSIGNSYVCIVTHTSDSTTEPGVGTYWGSYWVLVVQKGEAGSPWTYKGTWVTSATYFIDESVTSNGSLYVSKITHVSDSTTQPGTGAYWQTYWQLAVSKGDVGPRGVKGDQGTQGIQGVQGIQGATGATGATGETGPQGIQGPPGNIWNWQGYWILSHVYNSADGVSNDGSCYICTSNHTSDATTEPGTGTYWETYWDLVVAKGDVGATGSIGLTGDQGIQGVQGIQGAAGADGQGFSWQGYWVTSYVYQAYDVVGNDGVSYICILDHTSAAITEPGVGASYSTYWEVLITGSGGGSSSSVDLHDACILLDLSQAPPASGGDVINSGLIGDDLRFLTSGTWTRVALGTGYYWTNTDGAAALYLKPVHTEATAGASLYAAGCVVNNTGTPSCTFGITDTNNDLQALYRANQRVQNPRPYKIDIYSSGSGAFYGTGYIGAIAKSGNDYTMDIYYLNEGTSRYFKTFGTWSTTGVTWRIYPATFEIESGGTISSSGLSFGMSLWYAPGSDASSNQIIIGKYSTVSSDTIFKGFAVRHYTAGGTIATELLNNATVGITNVLPATTRWNHIAYLCNSVHRRLLINGRSIRYEAATGLAIPVYGLFGIGWDGTGVAQLPTNSLIAYPRFWRNAPSDATMAAIYEKERKILGLSWNH